MASVGFLAIDTNINNAGSLAMSAGDALAVNILGYLWLSSVYVFGMIWTVLALIDRWRGPHGEGEINFVSVLAAILLSGPWPAVLLVMALS